MALKLFWVRFTLFFGFWIVAFCDQDGFLSLSCGGAKSYVDSSKIKWVSDDTFITTGNTTTVEYAEGTSSSSSIALRFFPEPRGRNCYRLPVENMSSIVLVRAQFVYNNYDGLEKPPAFSVSLGRAIVNTVNLTHKDPWIDEFLWPVSKDTLSFCLQAIPDGGAPVISSLEVRPLPRGAYQSGMDDIPNKSLRKSYRINSGYTNGSLRYPVDPFDRIWDADQSYTPFHASPGFNIPLSFNLSSLKESPPLDVLQTARVLARQDVLHYNLPLDKLGDYYIVLYFASILPVSASFDILINGDVELSEFTIRSSEASTLYFKQKGIINLDIALRSIIFYPQINALEVYEIVDIPPETSSLQFQHFKLLSRLPVLILGGKMIHASQPHGIILNVKESYHRELLIPGYHLRDLSDINLRNLHNTSLSGATQNLGSLQHLEKLNLSFNQLTSFGSDISSLVNLRVLLFVVAQPCVSPDEKLCSLFSRNLENNKLQDKLPYRTSGNLCLSFSTMACNDVSSNPSIETPQVTVVTNRKHRGHRHLAIILGAAGGTLFALLLTSLLVLLYINKRKTEATYTTSAAIDMRNWNAARIFSYKEIKAATNNFKEVIGHGSFGSVYLGKLSDGKPVAVKVRFDKTQLGADSFINEVHLLSQIHHQNLVSLEGFCHELKHQILVYEYLPGGSLADHLYGPNSQKVSLSWIRRLKIAVDAAKGMSNCLALKESLEGMCRVYAIFVCGNGLDYLHNGSDPRIIHRDVKCSNILLDCEMNAKVCDFGLSKQVTLADATHVTTVVKGTAGYLDPEYYSTQQLTEKSDVYSFGVVLLELICGREPLTHSGTPDSFNLVLWAKPYLQAGALEIVDDNLKGTFDVESMRKTALVTVRCMERDASRRPTIAQVLGELKETYSLQLAYLASLGHSGLRLQTIVNKKKSDSDTKGKKSIYLKHKSKVQRGRIAAFGYRKSANFSVADGSSVDGGETMIENWGLVSGIEDCFPDDKNTQSGNDLSEATWHGFELSSGEGKGNTNEKFEVTGDGENRIKILEQAIKEEKAACAALYLELEKERAASASAADEAMAMILRLQEDKASIEMEATQYQRIIEEKFAYDEEEMNLLKEALVGREKENHLLEKEVEAYRQMDTRRDEPEDVDELERNSDFGEPLGRNLHNSTFDMEPTVYDVHVIDDNKESPKEENSKKSKLPIGSASDHKTFLYDLERSSSAVSNERLEIDAEIEHLTERLQIVGGEKEKLTSSADQRERIDILLKLIKEQVKQLREFQRLKEPVQQTSLPPLSPSSKVVLHFNLTVFHFINQG
ncbi:hypothetical protein GOBAR_AA04072 [Gossypium barbadense]|uniref:non-specific serine/threonine protein kinase n=1 Tax=Gossypium barbadense TaxID=3634 RepID=A0A2P5YLP5_GOSBA|nr:hypothetical protein GOBAR_AA04072 [Gossypium barbadense]